MPKSTKSNSNVWTTSDDNKLLALYKRNVPEFALAKILKKSITQIRERIMYLMKNNQGGVMEKNIINLKKDGKTRWRSLTAARARILSVGCSSFSSRK